VLRGGGGALGWGYQLQEPHFVAALALLMTAVALNLFGVFTIGASVARWAGGATETVGRHGLASAFWMGALTVVLATPCTAPFMGTAIGWALGAPAVACVLVFVALGLGLALPRLVLAWSPSLHRFVPRPGAWMVSFQRALAFPMLGTVVYLAWIFGSQTSVSGMAWLLAAVVLLSAAAWTYGRWGASLHSGRARIFGRIAAVALAVAACLQAVRAAEPEPEIWERWSREAVARNLSEGRTVLVDFTAAWCATCLVNESVVLETDTVLETAARHGVAFLKADWTRKDAAIAAELATFGRSSVPLYVVYSPHPGRAPKVLPTTITPGIVADALVEAADPRP
jgi:thiol:disulfide interchange protein DsbD